MLTFHQGRLAAGTLHYSQVAEVALPSAPTDLAALHFIVPTLAVGCEGRCVRSDCSPWESKLPRPLLLAMNLECPPPLSSGSWRHHKGT